jgi:hypothetical protein
MTREEARELRRQLRKAYPDGDVEVTRVFGGVEITAGDGGAHGYTFLRVADDSPLLVLLAAKS